MTILQTAVSSQSAYDRLTRSLEWPMAVLALAVMPALLLDNGSETPRVHLLAMSINQFVWLAFCAEFALKLRVAPDKRAFVRKSWFSLALIAVSPPVGVPQTWQGLRALRAMRLLRLLRAAAFLTIGLKTTRTVLQHRKFHYVLVLTTGVMLLGATGLLSSSVLKTNRSPRSEMRCGGPSRQRPLLATVTSTK